MTTTYFDGQGRIVTDPSHAVTAITVTTQPDGTQTRNYTTLAPDLGPKGPDYDWLDQLIDAPDEPYDLTDAHGDPVTTLTGLFATCGITDWPVALQRDFIAWALLAPSMRHLPEPLNTELDAWAKATLPGSTTSPETKAIRWNPALHPRDKYGKFIEAGAIVHLLGSIGGGEGRVVGNAPNNRIIVRREDGTDLTVPATQVTMPGESFIGKPGKPATFAKPPAPPNVATEQDLMALLTKGLNRVGDDHFTVNDMDNRSKVKAAIVDDLDQRLAHLPDEAFHLGPAVPPLPGHLAIDPHGWEFIGWSDGGMGLQPLYRFTRGGDTPLYSHTYVEGRDLLYAPDDPRLTGLRRRSMIDGLVRSWSITSNDHSPRPLALQKAAQVEFGLDHVADWPDMTPMLAKEIDDHFAEWETLYRAFLRAQYEATQERLREAGFTHAYLHRGFKDLPEGPVTLRPMSSFSAALATALGFAMAGGGDAPHIVGLVPIEHVLSSARTGFGCLSEYEFVVLGHPGVEWEVTRYARKKSLDTKAWNPALHPRDRARQARHRLDSQRSTGRTVT